MDNPTCQYRNRNCHRNSAVIMVFSGPLAYRLACVWTVGTRCMNADLLPRCDLRATVAIWR
ncbi:MAG: hypothetical protein R3F40_16425 [Candidatus Competibacteraceae bacterium]